MRRPHPSRPKPGAGDQAFINLWHVKARDNAGQLQLAYQTTDELNFRDIIAAIAAHLNSQSVVAVVTTHVKSKKNIVAATATRLSFQVVKWVTQLKG